MFFSLNFKIKMNMHGGFKEIIFFKFWITKSVGGNSYLCYIEIYIFILNCKY